MKTKERITTDTRYQIEKIIFPTQMVVSIHPVGSGRKDFKWIQSEFDLLEARRYYREWTDLAVNNYLESPSYKIKFLFRSIFVFFNIFSTLMIPIILGLVIQSPYLLYRRLINTKPNP